LILADLSEMEERSSFLIPLHQSIGDRASKRLKISRLYALIFSTLLMMFLGISSKSQISNELVFEQLILESASSHAHPVDSIQGFFTDGLLAKITRTPGADKDLIVETPSVDFKRLGKKRYERSLAIIVNYQDSTEHSYSLNHKDTLDAKALKEVRKTSYPELRGKNPRFASKYLGPALLIGTAIVGIISLFYLRS
jgi:hypothetical protein